MSERAERKLGEGVFFPSTLSVLMTFARSVDRWSRDFLARSNIQRGPASSLDRCSRPKLRPLRALVFMNIKYEVCSFPFFYEADCSGRCQELVSSCRCQFVVPRSLPPFLPVTQLLTPFHDASFTLKMVAKH